MTTLWAAGRYQTLAEQIAPIAVEVVEAVDGRLPVGDVQLLDLACGTGSAALAAAQRGARVTAVDITPELMAIGATQASAAGLTVDWRTADAAATGLPAGSFDAVVSNMGLIFVEPISQVAELGRVLRAGGVVGFSSWVPGGAHPFFDPIVSVLGPRPTSGYTPDQWGDSDTVTARLSPEFDHIEFEFGSLTWQFDSPEQAVHFVSHESPIHVDLLGRLEVAQRDRLLAAFDTTLREHLDGEGRVRFDAPYLVVTARRC